MTAPVNLAAYFADGTRGIARARKWSAAHNRDFRAYRSRAYWTRALAKIAARYCEDPDEWSTGELQFIAGKYDAARKEFAAGASVLRRMRKSAEAWIAARPADPLA